MKRVKTKERVSNKITTNKSLDITNIKIFKYTILILTLNSSEKNQKKSIKLVFLDENKNVTILDDKKSIDMVINKKTTIICRYLIDNKEKRMDKRGKNLNEENKKIMILVVAILVVILVCYLIISYTTNVNTNVEKEKPIKTIIDNSETTALYIWNSDAKKCKNCKEIEKYLNSKKIKYISYDVKNYSKDKYEKLLVTLGINPSDFEYPAVIYVKDGTMYSNIINISNTKTVETFIKNYELQKLK